MVWQNIKSTIIKSSNTGRKCIFPLGLGIYLMRETLTLKRIRKNQGWLAELLGGSIHVELFGLATDI